MLQPYKEDRSVCVIVLADKSFKIIKINENPATWKMTINVMVLKFIRMVKNRVEMNIRIKNAAANNINRDVREEAGRENPLSRI